MRKTLGRILIALALAVLVWEAVELTSTGEWRLKVFGEIFFRLAPDWLNVVQAVIQRYVSAWLWDPAIQTVLLWPAWPTLGIAGAVLEASARIRRRR